MGKYSKAFSIKKQFQSPNCQRCQGQSRTMKKIIFLELFLRIIEDEKWNLFEKIGQLRTPSSEHARGDNPAHFSKHSEYTILFILLPFPGFGNICNATIKLIGMTGSDHLLSTCTTERRTECNTFANTKNVQKGPTLTRIQKKWFGKFHLL